MNESKILGVEGILRVSAIVPKVQAHFAKFRGLRGMRVEEHGKDGLYVCGYRPNAFVNQGLQAVLDRAFAINGPPSAISHIGVTSDTTAVTASTTTLDAGATGDLTIVALSPAASRTGNTVTAGGPFTEANVDFQIRKVGLLKGATDTNNVIDIIGGVGGSAPYNEPFAIDLTTVTEFDLTLEIDVSLVAV